METQIHSLEVSNGGVEVDFCPFEIATIAVKTGLRSLPDLRNLAGR